MDRLNVNEPDPAQRRRANVGLVAILVALAALGVAAFQDDLRAGTMTERTTTERVVDGTKRFLGIDEAQPERRDYVRPTYIGLGVLAIALGVFAYIRREDHRVAGVAGALGAVAIAWEYLLIGFVVAVVIFVLANIESIFDF